MDQQTQLLREMRDLLRIIAEPALAKLDENRRAALRKIVGRSDKRAKAVLLMDGTRKQSAITKATGIDFGDLSRCVKALKEASLIDAESKDTPKLVITIPANFFD